VSDLPVEKKSLVELLTDRLREQILSGRYRKGSTLPPERELADTLHVNRTSLKHALVKLEQLGLIAIRHGVGSVVLDPTESAGAELISHLVFREGGIDGEMLSDLMEARTLLGGFIARLAAERRGEDDLARVDAIIDQLDEAARSASEVQRLELEFFRSLLRATENQIFVLLANSVFAVYRARARAFEPAYSDRGFVHDALDEIRHAIAERDGRRAEQLTLAYLRDNAKRFLDGTPDEQKQGRQGARERERSNDESEER
jgi:GntR family transcriptional regulator, transcriptional repressor for pyruvate dehydrogenase complex